MPPTSRRRLLRRSSVLAATALAGCTGGLFGDSAEETRLRERVRKLERKNANLSARLRSERNESRRLEANRTRLADRLAAERNETRRLRRRLENRTAELETLRGEIRAHERRITELQAEISVLKEGNSGSRFAESVRSKALTVGERVRKSVVFVQTEGADSVGHGTGLFLEDDLVVTNSHVIAGADEIDCWTLDGDRLDATVVGRVEDRDPDVAALRTDADGRPLDTGDSSGLSSDQPLLQVGHPAAFGNWVIALGRFHGRVRYRSADGGTHPELRTSVPTFQGSSGSPLVTLDGRVVGLTYAWTPKKYKQADEAPEPAPAKVYEAVSPNTYSLHETVERVLARVEDWE
ncbi:MULTISPECIES: S1C family serine protease [Halorussus]|uniref:S1C family serine protease n=1 Tax=Halorussus TaxID=1070314 RepID=UPI0020A0D12F|nr:trypsin-like peptidase domain-containing protein [Halorussus vallis]USZ76258.1 trypsin-like peptidase domain-containing protein [Halorussus vallis]